MFHHFGRHGRFRSPRPGCGESSPGLEAGGRHGRGGFGRFGFGGEFGMGPESFRGRKMGSVDLRLVLLTLLAERPSHGYELIKSLEERSGGFYSPSPGMVYPALTWLEEVGYAEVTTEGAKKRYAITDAGREHLKQHQEVADAILSQLEHIARRLGRMRAAFSGFEAQEGTGPQRCRVVGVAPTQGSVARRARCLCRGTRANRRGAGGGGGEDSRPRVTPAT